MAVAKEKEFDIRSPVRTTSSDGMMTLVRVGKAAAKPTQALKQLMRGKDSTRKK